MNQRPLVVQTAPGVSSDALLRYYEAFVAASPDAVLVVDEEGSILLANAAAEAVLGHAPSTIIHAPLSSVLHGDDAASVERLLEKAFAHPASHTQATFRVQHEGGEWRILEATFSHVQPHPEYVPRVVISARDITARIRTQQTLKEREAQLNRAERIAQLASWEINLTTGIVTAGRALFEIYGLAPQPCLDLEVLQQYYHPDDRDMVEEALRAAKAAFQPFEFCHRIVRADGQERTLQLRGEVELYGQDLLMYGTVQDVTASRKMEHKLSRSERRFRAIFDSLFQFIGIMEPDGTMLEVNRTALDFGGLQEEDVIGKPFWQCYWWSISEETRAWLQDAVAAAAQGQFIRTNVEVFGKGEQRATIDFTLKPVTDAEEHITFLIAEGRDITNQMQAQKALRESEKRYRTLIETMAEGVMMVDAEGTIQAFNPRARQIFKMSEEALQGRSVQEDWEVVRIDGTPMPPEEYPVTQTLRTRQPAEKVVMGISNGATGPTWVSVNTEPIFDEDGETLEAAVMTLHDVTRTLQHAAALRKSRQQLRQLAKRLHEAQEEERTRMAREVHDILGQAMSVLRMDISWLRDNAPDDDALTERIGQTMEHVNETIEMVRHISHQLRPGVLDHFGLAAALDWQSEQFEQRSGLSCSFSEETDDEGLAPDLATALFRIFQEALTNVARHAEATSVHTSLAEADGDLVLTVQDDGKGIDDEDLHPSDSLGLLNMRERVMPWDGQVEVTGTSGRGTTVIVRIPLSKARPTTP